MKAAFCVLAAVLLAVSTEAAIGPLGRCLVFKGTTSPAINDTKTCDNCQWTCLTDQACTSITFNGNSIVGSELYDYDCGNGFYTEGPGAGLCVLIKGTGAFATDYDTQNQGCAECVRQCNTDSQCTGFYFNYVFYPRPGSTQLPQDICGSPRSPTPIVTPPPSPTTPVTPSPKVSIPSPAVPVPASPGPKCPPTCAVCTQCIFPTIGCEPVTDGTVCPGGSCLGGECQPPTPSPSPKVATPSPALLPSPSPKAPVVPSPAVPSPALPSPAVPSPAVPSPAPTCPPTCEVCFACTNPAVGCVPVTDGTPCGSGTCSGGTCVFPSPSPAVPSPSPAVPSPAPTCPPTCEVCSACTNPAVGCAPVTDGTSCTTNGSPGSCSGGTCVLPSPSPKPPSSPFIGINIIPGLCNVSNIRYAAPVVVTSVQSYAVVQPSINNSDSCCGLCKSRADCNIMAFCTQPQGCGTTCKQCTGPAATCDQATELGPGASCVVDSLGRSRYPLGTCQLQFAADYFAVGRDSVNFDGWLSAIVVPEVQSQYPNLPSAIVIPRSL